MLISTECITYYQTAAWFFNYPQAPIGAKRWPALSRSQFWQQGQEEKKTDAKLGSTRNEKLKRAIS